MWVRSAISETIKIESTHHTFFKPSPHTLHIFSNSPYQMIAPHFPMFWRGVRVRAACASVVWWLTVVLCACLDVKDVPLSTQKQLQSFAQAVQKNTQDDCALASWGAYLVQTSMSCTKQVLSLSLCFLVVFGVFIYLCFTLCTEQGVLFIGRAVGNGEASH